MKKKVLIVLYSMDVGGVERALLGMLNKFDFSKTDVTLALARKKGDFLNEISPFVKVVEIKPIRDNWELLNKPLIPQIISRLKNGQIFEAYKLARCLLDYKLTGNYHKLFRYIFKHESSEKFDLAISYAGPSSLLDYYVSKVVNADKKLAWVHYDIEKFNVNHSSQRELYTFFDKIFVASETAKVIFDRVFPCFADRSDVFHNIIDVETIKKSAKESVAMADENAINLVTVGRISPEKGQVLAVEALNKLVKSGYQVHWTFVGGGFYESVVNELVRKYDIIEQVTITGVCKNPYPYFRSCDIYIQPSVHEGYCITLSEAKIFGPPIVATDFTGAREQLLVYDNGVVVSHSASELYSAIRDIIERKLYLVKNVSENQCSDFHKLENYLL